MWKWTLACWRSLHCCHCSGPYSGCLDPHVVQACCVVYSPFFPFLPPLFPPPSTISPFSLSLPHPLFFLPSLSLSFSYLPRKHLHQKDIVLNYKDSSGDLIEMTSNEDIELMKSEGISPQIKSSGAHAPWAIYVTVAGDHNPYNTSPYK